MKSESMIKPLNLPAILFLHLFPGVIILLVSVILANPNWGLGLPAFLSLLLAILFGLIPVELGILYYIARKESKKINEIVRFNTKMPLGKTLLWALPCFIVAFMTFGFIKEWEHKLFADIFLWVPSWFRIDILDIGSGSSLIIGLTVILNFILNGILGPYVEELYFRGYLLPRMSRLGKWAPFINTVLFSLYHFFTPWENITRIVAITPMSYVTWFNQNIRISIIVHCTLNTMSAIMLVFYLVNI